MLSAALLVGIGKGGFGGALAAVATPLVALSTSVPDAAAMLLPVLISADIFATYSYRKNFDRPNIRRLVPFAIVGVIIASIFFGYFSSSERMLKFAIGIIAVGFVLFQLSRSLISKNLKHAKASRLGAAIWGTIAGFTSTLAHVGGPPIYIYLLPQNLPKDRFVGTNAVFFFIINLIKLLAYFILGLLSLSNLGISFILIPVALLGTRLGVFLNKRVSQRAFNIFIYAMLLITGLELIVGKNLISMFAK